MAEGHDRRKHKHLGLFEGLIPRRRSSLSAQASRSASPTATLIAGAATPPVSPPVSGHPVTQASASAHELSSNPSSSGDHARTGTVLDNEPTEAYSGPVSTGLAILKSALQLTEKVSDVCPHLKVAVGGLLGVVELIEQVRDVHEDFKDIAAKIDAMVKTLGKYQSWLSVNQTEVNEWVDAILHKIEQLKSALEKKLKRNVIRRALLMPADRREVVRCLRAVGDSVDIILMNMNMEELAKLDMLVQSDFKAKLSPVKSARHDAMDIPPCLEKTRVQLLEDILAWAVPREGKSVSPVFFLSGVAGSGKSTVAKSVCAKLQGIGILGASFFCSRRSTAEQRDVRSIFRTLAYLLSLHSPKFATEVYEALKNNPDAAVTVPKDQFRMLIDTPAKAAFTTAEPVPIIVIDAVDECDDVDATYDLLEIILREVPRLHLKFLVTSRPEARIRDVFGKPGSTALRLQDIDSNVVDTDIGKYLTSKLTGPNDDWPSPNDMNTLVSRSRGLFIYAATACKYVTYHSGDRRERLQKLVSPHGRPLVDMEQMYDLIVDQAQFSLDDEEVSAVRWCLTAVACVRDPVSVHDFAHFLDLTSRIVRIAFVALHSVVDVPESDDGHITTYHASFPEYLTSSARSPSKVADPKVIHCKFFDKCLETMKSGLFFNVSGCSTSYATNTKQPSHSELSPCLRYACRFFVDHLTMSSCSVESAVEKVAFFLQDRFLHWLEALSASGHAGVASSLLMRLVVWFRAQPSADRTDSVAACLRLLLDANQFLVRFRTPILESAPHVYLSALAFAPPSSEIAKKWQGRLERRLDMHTKQRLEVLPLLRLHGHESEILKVAFPTNGRQTRIASASRDGIIRFWDTGTGDTIGHPVQGPMRRVRSVAFSPDGTRVVSASPYSNYSLLIWDTETGSAVGRPLEGHTDDVNAIAFSPNGDLIASASDDGTIRVWDTKPSIGAPASRPPMRHGQLDTVGFQSLVFSPDGAYIASGSIDGPVSVWNVKTCNIIWKQCIGHNGRVLSVAFSADGKHIVSASYDTTIRMWDAKTGAVIGQELRGHTSWVRSAVFSPNGRLIASSSYDKTVRVWNVETGCELQVLKGHTDWVNTTMFSPDGSLIVTASADKTICIWDGHMGAKDIQPLERHTDSVRSVMFSPDGRRVVSGSSDKTIRLWNSETGGAVGLPFKGHQGKVVSVAFSVDGLNIASASDDGTICIWNAATDALVSQPLAGRWVESIAISPDGRHIVSGSGDGAVRVWDAQTGVTMWRSLKGHHSGVTSVVYSRDGKLIVSGSRDTTVRVWDAGTGAFVGQPFEGHINYVTSVVCSPDGRKVASGSEDKTVRIWDTQIGTAVGKPLEGHTGDVNSVAFSPDGRHVVSASDDKTILVWDVETCTAVGWPLKGHTESVTSVAFSPDGMHIVSGSEDRTVRIWDASFRMPSIPRAVDKMQHTDDNRAPSPLSGSVGPRRNRARTVAFSPNSEHVCELGILSNSSQPEGTFCMTDDGWILGPQGELFLWIPPEYRLGLSWPRMTAITGAHSVRLDLSRFTHGTEWSDCWCLDSSHAQ